MGAKRPDSFDNGEKSREDRLEVAVCDRPRIESEILPNQFPDWLQVLSLRQSQSRFRNVSLTQRLQNVACSRHSFTRLGLDVAQRSLELMIDGSEIKLSEHRVKGTGWNTESADDVSTSDVLQIVLCEYLLQTFLVSLALGVIPVVGIRHDLHAVLDQLTENAHRIVPNFIYAPKPLGGLVKLVPFWRITGCVGV